MFQLVVDRFWWHSWLCVSDPVFKLRKTSWYAMSKNLTVNTSQSLLSPEGTNPGVPGMFSSLHLRIIISQIGGPCGLQVWSINCCPLKSLRSAANEAMLACSPFLLIVLELFGFCAEIFRLFFFLSLRKPSFEQLCYRHRRSVLKLPPPPLGSSFFSQV